MIFRTPILLPFLYPQLVWRKNKNERTIFLTFDDGPVPGPTEFVLDNLKQFGIRATFFCIGDNVKKHPALFARMIKEGHAIGNHTFNHINGWKHAASAYLNNVEQCSAQFHLSGFQASRPHLFRPPYGRIRRSQIKLLRDYTIIMWDVLTHDYAATCSPERCLRGAVKATRPGSIVVFHDSYKAEVNLTYVLPRYLEYFSAQGYSFAPL